MIRNRKAMKRSTYITSEATSYVYIIPVTEWIVPIINPSLRDYIKRLTVKTLQ